MVSLLKRFEPTTKHYGNVGLENFKRFKELFLRIPIECILDTLLDEEGRLENYIKAGIEEAYLVCLDGGKEIPRNKVEELKSKIDEWESFKIPIGAFTYAEISIPGFNTLVEEFKERIKEAKTPEELENFLKEAKKNLVPLLIEGAREMGREFFKCEFLTPRIIGEIEF